MLKNTLEKLFLASILLMFFVLAPSANAQYPPKTAADDGPCRDPYINYAFRTELNRKPIGRGNAGECNIYLYKAGSWNNYTELRSAVKSYDAARQRLGISVSFMNGVYKMVKQNKQLEAQLRAVAGPITKVFDLMGNMINQFKTGQYSLQAADGEKVDLGGGSTLVIK